MQSSMPDRKIDQMSTRDQFILWFCKFVAQHFWMRHTVETATETAFPPASGVRTVKKIKINNTTLVQRMHMHTKMHILESTS
jgi:hypothetical protein